MGLEQGWWRSCAVMSGLRVSAPSHVIQVSSIYRLVLFTGITGGRTECGKIFDPDAGGNLPRSSMNQQYICELLRPWQFQFIYGLRSIFSKTLHGCEALEKLSEDRCIDASTGSFPAWSCSLCHSCCFCRQRISRAIRLKAEGFFRQRSKVRFTRLCGKGTERKVWSSGSRKITQGALVGSYNIMQTGFCCIHTK